MLDALAAMGSPPIEQTSPVEARAAYAQLAMMSVPEEVDRVDDRHVPVPEGDDIPVRVYTPADAVAGEAGVLVWFHGGGWVIRSEEHTSELQSLMRISYAVFCLKKKTEEISELKSYHS